MSRAGPRGNGTAAAVARARSSAEPRLVPAPVFIISAVRSGSTLLRVLLDSHPQLHAPHELHLRAVRVELKRRYAERSMRLLGLDVTQLEYLLWDRILHRELARSGKAIIVDKTPGNAFAWRRLRACWPDARFVFLLRHPASVVDSLMRGHRTDRTLDGTVAEVLHYVEGVEDARRHLDGLTVRYEDLASDPEAVTRRLCEFLGVPWTAAMLDYGRQDHGPYRSGIGDWSENIRSGRVQPPRPLPQAADVPPQLREISRAWGYLD